MTHVAASAKNSQLAPEQSRVHLSAHYRPIDVLTRSAEAAPPSSVGPRAKEHGAAVFGGAIRPPGQVQFDNVALGIQTAANGGVQ
eukprot:4014564-Pyramimonas_sp.AAC.1